MPGTPYSSSHPPLLWPCFGVSKNSTCYLCAGTMWGLGFLCYVNTYHTMLLCQWMHLCMTLPVSRMLWYYRADIHNQRSDVKVWRQVRVTSLTSLQHFDFNKIDSMVAVLSATQSSDCCHHQICCSYITHRMRIWFPHGYYYFLFHKKTARPVLLMAFLNDFK